MNHQNHKLKIKNGVGQGSRTRVAPTAPHRPSHHAALPACAGALARMRGILFLVRTIAPLTFSDGSEHVPAGALGCAVLAWRGDQPGWVVEFGPHGVAGLRASDERQTWVRVPSERPS